MLPTTASADSPKPTVKTLDAFGRHIHYLRVSLTDKCNLRCVYCMPEQVVFRPNDELLTDDELFTVLRAADQLGFDKYRLTGGEPTVRPNLVNIVRGIRELPNTTEMAMTTNGIKLKQLAVPLHAAGLARVNISIDSLDPEKFKRITRWGKVQDVLDGIEAAERAGMTPVKLNAVVIRGFNEEDVVPLAKLTIDRRLAISLYRSDAVRRRGRVSTGHHRHLAGDDHSGSRQNSARLRSKTAASSMARPNSIACPARAARSGLSARSANHFAPAAIASA